jgi:hypothetical protein
MTNDVITKVFLLLVTCFALWVIWKAAQPQSVFTVRIAEGKAEAAFGKITPSFLIRVQEVAEANMISRGRITGCAHGKLIRLKFSVEIPEPAQQQLRNWWATSGWNAPPVGQPKCRS